MDEKPDPITASCIGAVEMIRLPWPHESLPGARAMISLYHEELAVGAITMLYIKNLELGKKFSINIKLEPINEEEFLKMRGLKQQPNTQGALPV